MVTSAAELGDLQTKPKKAYLLMLCDQPILVRGTITIFLILIIPIYWLFTIDKRRVNLKVQYSVVRK